MTTPYLPFALIEAMLFRAPVSPIRSIVLSWRPAVRLYTTSSDVSGFPSDHFAFFARLRVSVLLPFVHFQLRASQGTVWTPPAETTTRGS